jgi:hypothetical protein
MPTIRETYDSLVLEKQAIIENSKPLHNSRSAIRKQIADLESSEKVIIEQIKSAESGLYKISTDIASLARLLPEHKKISE